MEKLLNSLYYDIFIWLYIVLKPIFQNPKLTIYIAILAIASTLVYLNYKWIQRKKDAKHRLKLSLAMATQVYLIGFLIWFVFIHFQSYKVIH